MIKRLVVLLISPFIKGVPKNPLQPQCEIIRDRKWNFAPIHCTSPVLAEIQTFHYALTRPWRGQSKPRYSTAWKIGRFDNIPPVGACDSYITASTKGTFHLHEVSFFRFLFCRFYASPIKLASLFFCPSVVYLRKPCLLHEPTALFSPNVFTTLVQVYSQDPPNRNLHYHVGLD